MSIIKTFVKRPVTTSMVILIFMAFGVLSLTNLKIDMMPEMDIPVAIVSTSYNGAASEEMEKLITKPLESALGTVPGIKTINSTSSNGSSIIILQFVDDTNIDQAALDMREKVDMIKGFLPTDATDPVVMKIDINSLSGSTSIGVKSKSGNMTELQNIVDNKLKGRLERQKGVASVSTSGGISNQVSVVLQEDKLRGYGISENQISQMLRAENLNTPTGSVKQGNANLSLRVEGQFADVEDIKNLPLTTGSGATIFLSDVADVMEVQIDQTSYSYIDGQPAVLMTVQKQSTANTVEVSNALLKEMSKISEDTNGIELVMLMDPAEYIRNSIGNVAQSAMLGALLAILILFIFLRDVRTTIIVGLAIPISMIMTFALMYFAGITINIMSLGGLTLGVGMLVDNSIVVVESIYRKMESGESKFKSAIDGASEVAMSVIASTITTIVVFLPITFAGGMAAQIFNQLSFTISFALISSLFASLTFVPMAASILLITEEEKLSVGIVYKALSKFNDGFEKLQNSYRSLLKAAMKRSWVVYVVVIVFLGVTGFSATRLGMAFMPDSDEGMVMISVEMPSGTILEDTQKMAFQVVDTIKDAPEIQNISMTVGGASDFISGASSDKANITVNLTPKLSRNRSAKEMETLFNSEVSAIPGAKITATSSQGSMGSFGGGAIEITIKGDDLDKLKKTVDDFTGIFTNIAGVTDISSSLKETSPQANIIIDRKKATSYGISASSVASIINTAVNGSVPTTLKITGDELDIRVEQDTSKFEHINDIENILIPSATGVNVPLYEIGTVDITYPPVAINRVDQQRNVTLSVSTDGTATSIITKEFEKQLQTYIMLQGCTWEYTGSTEQMNETFGSLALALVMAIFLVYMVMAAEFESLIYPFIVMFSIPVAISGGVFGLAVVGEPISITSFLGMIMLSGLVINSAIILIDYTNLLIRRDKMSIEDALLVAGPTRLRPIIMSVATTCLGLIPMATSNASGAELMKGLAVLVISGLLFSTLITLILVPVVYRTITNRNNKRKAKKEVRRLAKIEKYNKIKEAEKNKA